VKLRSRGLRSRGLCRGRLAARRVVRAKAGIGIGGDLAQVGGELDG